MSLTLKYVDKQQLDELFLGKEPFIIAYIRDHCPDSGYAMDNFLLPYVDSYKGKGTIYVFEFERNGYYDLETMSYPLKYWIFLEDYLLSEASNQRLGYDKGHVPTYQFIVPNGKPLNKNNNVIEDMCVIYNDKKGITSDEKVFILDSYFDGTRPLKYTDINLKGRELPAWRRVEIGVYHNYISKQFFDYYLEKIKQP